MNFYHTPCATLLCPTRISCAASVLGGLRKSVFSDAMLSVVHGLPSCDTGCSVICCGNLACETREVHTLETFHHHCLRTSLVLQISQHISNEEVRNRAGLPVPFADLHTNTCTHARTHARTHTHIHAHTHTNTHKHTHTLHYTLHAHTLYTHRCKHNYM